MINLWSILRLTAGEAILVSSGSGAVTSSDLAGDRRGDVTGGETTTHRTHEIIWKKNKMHRFALQKTQIIILTIDLKKSFICVTVEKTISEKPKIYLSIIIRQKM